MMQKEGGCINRKNIVIVCITILLFSFNVNSASIDETYPEDEESDMCPNNIDLCVTATSPTGSPMNITFYSNLTGVWDYFYVGYDNTTYYQVSNGTYCINVPYFSRYNHAYFWNVSIDDGITVNDSATFSFTTAESEDNCTISQSSSPVWIVGIVLSVSVFGILAFIEVKRRS